jgi:hypothetical protein
MMSLRNSFRQVKVAHCFLSMGSKYPPLTKHSYSQFHGLAYMVKLHIELVMTGLIVKIVQAPHIPDYNAFALQLQPSTTRNHPTSNGERGTDPIRMINKSPNGEAQTGVKEERSLSGTTVDNNLELDRKSVADFVIQNLEVEEPEL